MIDETTLTALEILREATSLPIEGIESVEGFLERYFDKKLLYRDGRPVGIGSSVAVPGTDDGPVEVVEFGRADGGRIVLRGTTGTGRAVRVVYPANGTAVYAPPMGLDGIPMLEGEIVFDVRSDRKYRIVGIARSDDAPLLTLYPMDEDRGIPLIAADARRFVHEHPLRDSEGELVVKGERVYDLRGNGPFTVVSTQREPRPMVGLIDSSEGYDRRFYLRPEEIVHRSEVIDIDAAVIGAGDTVYLLDSTDPATVLAVSPEAVTVDLGDGDVRVVAPEALTHTRPILDAHGVRIARFDRVWLTDDRFIDAPAAKVVEAEDPERIVLSRRGADAPIIAPASRLTHVRPMTQSRIEANLHGLIDGLSDELDEGKLDMLREGVVDALAQQRDIDAAVQASQPHAGGGIAIIDEPPTRLGRFIERSKERIEAWRKELEERKGIVHVRRS